jgi:hypothetical protein
MGRPEIPITEELCQKAETLASQGLTMEQIAAVLGMGSTALYEKQAKYSELAEAIKTGRQKGIAIVTNALMDTAKSGNVAAQIFYLKNRDRVNWKDKQDTEITGPDGGAIITRIERNIVTPKHSDS